MLHVTWALCKPLLKAMCAAGGASPFPQHLPHALPGHRPDCGGHLPRVWRPLQSFPQREALFSPAHALLSYKFIHLVAISHDMYKEPSLGHASLLGTDLVPGLTKEHALPCHPRYNVAIIRA